MTAFFDNFTEFLRKDYLIFWRLRDIFLHSIQYFYIFLETFQKMEIGSHAGCRRECSRGAAVFFEELRCAAKQERGRRERPAVLLLRFFDGFCRRRVVTDKSGSRTGYCPVPEHGNGEAGE